MFYSGLEYLDEPRELERMATPFGGGMHMGDHCGFYCAGLMLIGLASSGLEDGKKSVGQAQKSFTEAWKKSWPLLCREIREGRRSKKIEVGCKELGKAAGKELGKLLAPFVANPQRARFSKRSK